MTARSKSVKPIVATFLHRYRWGLQIRGDERGFVEKALRFKRLGLTMMVFEKQPSLQEDMEESVYDSINLGSVNVPLSNLFQLGALLIRSIVAVLARVPRHPLAIYAYNQDVENVTLGLFLKLFTGSPLVIVYHQVDRHEIQPLRDGYAARRSSGSSPLSAAWHSIFPAINWFSVHHADIHLALSESTRNEVIDILQVDCAMVGNGVDTQKFRPLITPKLYDACFLGRLAHQKGIDIILRAWKIVVERDSTARLILIGGGERGNIRNYRQIIEEMGMQKNVNLAGFLPDSEVVRILNSSKLFVFPSRRDGFAQAVSQAMACGCCCILSDIPSFIENYSAAAVIVPSESPESLSHEIIRLLQDDRSRSELGERARSLVSKFSWDDVVQKELEQMYDYYSRSNS